MRNLFSEVLNMSMTGSIVILLVMLARLILKRSPKIFSYALWSVVLFRLLCPVAFTAPVSVLEAFQPEIREASDSTTIVSYLPVEPVQERKFTFIPPQPQSEAMAKQPASHSELDIMKAAACIWIGGAAVMLLYSAVQYILLRMRLIGAVVYRGNVYLADYLDTPFVMGILRPKIYLPSNVPAKERKYIIAHERHHIRRLDHIIKLLSYLALCVHWFNPLVWAAFLLAGKDMEMSCDEAVIKRMGSQIRADYSASLLRLATHKKIIAGTPLAFGEGDTKGRVMNMAKWKKPRLWVSLICMLLCAAVLAACAVNPENIGQLGDPNSDGPTATFSMSQTDGAPSDSIYTDGPAAAALDSFRFTLPEGMSMETAPGNAQAAGYAFFLGETTVGGIALREQAQPNSPDSFSQPWQAALGVPEASDDALAYIGGSSDYADYEITYFPDMPVNRDDNENIIRDEQGTYVLEHEVTHYFFISGTDVYDLWFYDNRLPDITQETLLKSCRIEGVTDIAAMESALKEEREALEQCRRVLAEIQSSGAFKIETKRNNGNTALNESTLLTAWGYGEDRLNIAIIPESGGSSTNGGLLVDGVRYECGADREWREVTWWDWQDPWLASFQWDESVISYQDTMTQEDEISVMLRIDQPFASGENEQPHYFVSFIFDPEGGFRNVYIQTNVFTSSAVTMTESIVTLDPETVSAEIQEESQRAVG